MKRNRRLALHISKERVLSTPSGAKKEEKTNGGGGKRKREKGKRWVSRLGGKKQKGRPAKEGTESSLKEIAVSQSKKKEEEGR